MSAIVAPRVPWCSKFKVVLGGVGAGRSAGRGAAVPNAERLDAFFQIVDIGHIELEPHNLGCTMSA
jgi:hypothetical protein